MKRGNSGLTRRIASAVVAALATFVVVVPGHAGAQPPDGTQTPDGAQPSGEPAPVPATQDLVDDAITVVLQEIALITSIDGFSSPVPIRFGPIASAHGLSIGQPADGLLDTLAEVEAEAVVVLGSWRAQGSLVTPLLEQILGALPPDDLDRLEAGEPISTGGDIYLAVLGDLLARDGLPPAELGPPDLEGLDVYLDDAADLGPAEPPSPPDGEEAQPEATTEPAESAAGGSDSESLPDDASSSSLPVGLVVALVIAAAGLVVGLVALRRVRSRTDELGTMAELALVDSLTSLNNRRRLDQDLPERLTAPATDGSSLAVVMVDVDHFKQLNDTHGHATGDEVLRQVAGLLASSVRPGDQVYRYGGEEFCLVLPRADETEALDVAERVRAAIESTSLPGGRDQPDGRLTISAGVAATWPDITTAAAEAVARSLQKRADDALYAAKGQGRNRVVASSSLAGGGPAQAADPSEIRSGPG